jgi:hypothetical protein
MPDENAWWYIELSGSHYEVGFDQTGSDLILFFDAGNIEFYSRPDNSREAILGITDGKTMLELGARGQKGVNVHFSDKYMPIFFFPLADELHSDLEAYIKRGVLEDYKFNEPVYNNNDNANSVAVLYNSGSNRSRSLSGGRRRKALKTRKTRRVGGKKSRKYRK